MDYKEFSKNKEKSIPNDELLRMFRKLNFFITGIRHESIQSESNSLTPEISMPLEKMSSLIGQVGEKLSNALLNYIWTHDTESFYITELDKDNNTVKDKSDATPMVQEKLSATSVEFTKNLLKFIRYWIDFGNAIMIIHPGANDLPVIQVHSPLTSSFTVDKDNKIKEIFIPKVEKKDEKVSRYYEYYSKEIQGALPVFKYSRVDEETQIIEEIFSSTEQFFFLARLGESELTHPYGIGKGCNVVGDVATLNTSLQLLFFETSYALNPTIVMKDRSITGMKTIERKAGSIILINAQEDDVRKVVTTLPRIENNIMNTLLASNQQTINSIMEEYLINDLFNLERRSDTTATEVQAREANKLSSIRPMLETLYIDLLSPLIISILFHYGGATSGTKYKVNYNSSAARAGELKRLEGQVQFVQLSAQMGQLDPKSPFLIKIPELLRSYISTYSIDKSFVRTDKQIDDRLEEIQEAQAQQQAQEQNNQ